MTNHFHNLQGALKISKSIASKYLHCSKLTFGFTIHYFKAKADPNLNLKENETISSSNAEQRNTKWKYTQFLLKSCYSCGKQLGTVHKLWQTTSATDEMPGRSPNLLFQNISTTPNWHLASHTIHAIYTTVHPNMNWRIKEIFFIGTTHSGHIPNGRIRNS